MRTLEEFQKQVLAPLRKERDDKQDAAREARSNAAAEYMKAKKMIEEKEHAFKELQEYVLEAFIHQQLLDRKAYKLLLTAERTDACAKYDKAKHDEKIAKRRDGSKIITKCLKDFDDLVNGNAVFKENEKHIAVENLKKLRENIDKKIDELSE